MDTLRERFAHALARLEGETPASLAKKIGVTRQTLYNIENGTTKADAVRAVTLYPLADALGVRAEWLLYGRGPMEGTTEKNSRAGTVPVSQFGRLDPAILTQAKRWILAEETLAGPYPHGELVDQVAAIYNMMAENDGPLTHQQREERFAAAQLRQQQGKADDEHNGTASGSGVARAG